MKKLTLLLLASAIITFTSCKKEEKQLGPVKQTNTTPTAPKLYTYKKAHIYEVKFFALYSFYTNRDIRFVTKKGNATLFQSIGKDFSGALPFSLFDTYNTSNLITNLNTIHTLNFDYQQYYGDPYTNFVNWDFTPSDYLPAPSITQEKDTTISLSTPDNSIIFDVTFRFKGE